MKKVFSIMFLFLIFISIATAMTWPLGKEDTCNLLNKTGSACEETWCGVWDYNFDVNKSVCVYIPEEHFNNSANLTGYYDKSEIDSLLANHSINQTGNFTTKEYVDEQNRLQTNSTINRFNDMEESISMTTAAVSGGGGSNGGATNWWAIVAGFGILIVAIVVMTYMKESKKPGKPVGQMRRNFGNGEQPQQPVQNYQANQFQQPAYQQQRIPQQPQQQPYQSQMQQPAPPPVQQLPVLQPIQQPVQDPKKQTNKFHGKGKPIVEDSPDNDDEENQVGVKKK